jgi:hypothetical protein
VRSELDLVISCIEKNKPNAALQIFRLIGQIVDDAIGKSGTLVAEGWIGPVV